MQVNKHIFFPGQTLVFVFWREKWLDFFIFIFSQATRSSFYLRRANKQILLSVVVKVAIFFFFFLFCFRGQKYYFVLFIFFHVICCYFVFLSNPILGQNFLSSSEYKNFKMDHSAPQRKKRNKRGVATKSCRVHSKRHDVFSTQAWKNKCKCTILLFCQD